MGIGGLLRRHQGDVIATVFLALVSGIITIWWAHGYINSFTLQTHGDQALTQALAQMMMQTGPFAINDHVGWFSGFNPWEYPVAGSLLFSGVAWIAGWLIKSSSDVLVLIMALTSVLVSVFTYTAFRLSPGGSVSRLLAWPVALAFGISPYVLGKYGHYNVAAIYLIPATITVFALLIRLPNLSRRLTTVLFAGLALVALSSPLWWNLSVMYFLLLGLFVALVLRKRWWIARVSGVLFAVIIGTLVPLVLSAINYTDQSSWNRSDWDSTIYSGSFTDFFFGSPTLTKLLPGLDRILPATSREISEIGFVPLVFALVALVFVVTAYLGVRREKLNQVGWILVALQLAVLSFLTLGLGTVQEVVLELIGANSPLRVWSRLTWPIAFLGALLALPWCSRVLDRLGDRLGDQKKKLSGVVIALAIVIVSIVEVRAIVVIPSRALPTLEELPAVQFIQDELGNCPVVQLPVGTFPDFPMADGTIDHYYRGFVPYLINPEGTWSFGSVKGSPSDSLLRSLPTVVTPGESLMLTAEGFCAILFDKEYANWLNGMNANWAGQSVQLGEPQFSRERFDVYVLK